MIGEQPYATEPVWGCVLIGGKSRRMGQPKHLLEEQGGTWVERTVTVLQTRVEQVVIAGQGRLPASLAGMRRVADAGGLQGPLAGILAAFRRYPEVSWLVAACDLPDMETAALQWLLDHRRPGVLAVLPTLDDDGRVEPLLAYYDQSCRTALEEMAADGRLRLQCLRDFRGVLTPQPPVRLRRCWCNVNTPQDLAMARPNGVARTTNG